MAIPSELHSNPPRDIKNANALLSDKLKRFAGPGPFLFPSFLIPAVAFLFWLKFDDLTTGLMVGFGIAAFAELFVVAMFVNSKKVPELFINGIATAANVQMVSGGKNMIMVRLAYKDSIGKEWSGSALVNGAGVATIKAGDQSTVLYLTEKPETFMVYSDTMVSVAALAK